MYMIQISADFKKINLITSGNIKTNITQYFIYLRANHSVAVLGWADEMVHQDRNIMPFMNVSTHS